MQQLGAIDLATEPSPNPTSINPTQTLVPEAGSQSSAAPTASLQPAAATAGAAALPQGAAAVGWGLSIFSHAEEGWVKGQVLSWNARHGQHHVLYEDGEDEWLRLGKERVQWHSHKCNIAQRAGVQKGMCHPDTSMLTCPCNTHEPVCQLPCSMHLLPGIRSECLTKLTKLLCRCVHQSGDKGMCGCTRMYSTSASLIQFHFASADQNPCPE